MQKIKDANSDFDLLYLEEFECVTHELPASLRLNDPSTHTPIFETGKLLINSKSLVFIPSVAQKPFYKFLFKYFTKKPFTTKENKKTIQFDIKRIVEVKRDGPPSRYLNRNVLDEKDRRVRLEITGWNISSLCDWASLLMDLKDNEGQIDDLVLYVSNLMLSRFDIGGLDSSVTESVSETLLLKADRLVQRISPMVEFYGFLYLTNKHFYFKRLVVSSGNNYERVPLKNIKKLLKRRLYLQPKALEIELTDGDFFFFGFRNEEERDGFYDLLCPRLPSDSLTEKSLTTLRDAWMRRELSNFDYLLSLNQLAGRSFNDLSQYPVFPWLLINFDVESIDVEDPNNYRDLKEPIGALNKRRLDFFLKRYSQLPVDERFMYGTHYSTPGYVAGYLLRQHPGYMLRLQNGKFDLPDRLFHSIKKDWKNCYEHDGCIKELLPEFYSNDKRFLNNGLGLELGKRQNGKVVGDVKLPRWANSAEDYLRINRRGWFKSFGK